MSIVSEHEPAVCPGGQEGLLLSGYLLALLHCT